LVKPVPGGIGFFLPVILSEFLSEFLSARMVYGESHFPAAILHFTDEILQRPKQGALTGHRPTAAIPVELQLPCN